MDNDLEYYDVDADGEFPPPPPPPLGGEHLDCSSEQAAAMYEHDNCLLPSALSFNQP
jgi:hypothetical protein